MAREDPTVARHIDHVFPALTERLALEQPVRALLDSPGYAAVQRLIQAEADAVNRPMDAASRPLEQAEYAQRHGRLGALHAFEAAAETLLQRIVDDHREQQEQHEASGGESGAGR